MIYVVLHDDTFMTKFLYRNCNMPTILLHYGVYIGYTYSDQSVGGYNSSTVCIPMQPFPLPFNSPSLGSTKSSRAVNLNIEAGT